MQSGVGDLNVGRIRIVHTPLEGQLRSRLEALEAETRKARYQLRKSERNLEELTGALQTSIREHHACLSGCLSRKHSCGSPSEAHDELSALLSGWAVIALAGLVLGLIFRSVLRLRTTTEPLAHNLTPAEELPRRGTVGHR
jgi:hypothetical protein